VDFAAAGLLDDLEGEERSARRKLLERLARDGVGLDELQEAVAEDRLPLLPLERVLGGRHTAREVAERAGSSVEVLLRNRRALGLPEAGPDDPVFSDDDVEAAQALKLLLDSGLPEDAMLEATRVLGEGMARFAATSAALFSTTFLQPGDTELDVALRYEAMAKQLTPATTPLLVAALSAHLRESTRQGMLSRAQREAGSPQRTQQIVVCFADLVGFTTLGSQIDPQELGSVAGRFAELAADVASEPVRLVKTIGDAAMFVSPQPTPMVASALSLVESVEQADLPALRAGVASGPALQRAGDWYGNGVNLASRVTGAARPGSVLCTEDVRDAAADDFAWSFAGRQRLKGLREPVPLYRSRRLGPDTDQDRGATEGNRADRRPKHSDASSPKADRRRKRASSSQGS
jgi:adenylate cyclase